MKARASGKYAGKPSAIGRLAFSSLMSSRVPILTCPPKPPSRFGQKRAMNPASHLGQPEGHPAAERDAQQAPARHPLDGVVPEALDGLRGQRLGLVDRLDVVVAHGWLGNPLRSAQRAKWSPFVLFSKNGRYGMTKL